MRISVSWIKDAYETRERKVTRGHRKTFKEFQSFSIGTVGKWITVAKKEFLASIKEKNSQS